MGPAVSGFAEVGPALHGLRNVWSTMSAAGAGRPAKRARLEADKRRDALAEVEDKYADIDFTRFQKVVDIDTDADGEATPLRFVLVRPVETALVKDWRQWSSYEPDEAGETLSEEGLAHLCTTRRQRRHYTGPFGCTVQWFCCSHDALGHAACWVVRFKWPALRHGASLCRQCRRAVHACR